MIENNCKMKGRFLTGTIPEKHRSPFQYRCNTFPSQFISHRL